MINTILFDLDGTLLPIKQESFINAYFGEIVKRFAPHGYSKDQLINSIWAGTKEMIKNDGSRTNYDAFWDKFSELLGKDILKLVPEFESFYQNEFHNVQNLVPQGYSVRGLLDELKDMGFTLVLATNPIFPRVAAVSRLSWIGATMDDFAYVTTMENSHYCKPNIDYYKDLLKTIGKAPEECLMVGNNAIEDMCISSLGCKVFLMMENLENEKSEDITIYPQGGVDELFDYIKYL